MNTSKSIVAINPPTSPGITLTLESTGIFLGILVSVSVLGTLAVSVISKMNRISISITQIEETLKTHASNAQKISDLERRFELHEQEYVNRKDVLQMILGQINEKIDHKFKRSLFYTRDIQRFLQRSTDYQIREYEEHTSSPEE
ncbi:hypothetical protein [Anabaena subtropica]|uniref:Uncharacterized protein n=1 Tax=Anabaena subtropica FACHB-260 TaxID=2692884 RepID=A0ABR8CMK4_9NOST|nr:hypothetical protein [Anabaena subtropica]MBD2344164.1 hypothetical protein [Anabaena subtropica FACHB-260]